MGLITVREFPERARAMAVPGRIQADMLKAAAIVPVMEPRGISTFEPRDVRRLRLRLEGADLSNLDLQGTGQTAEDTAIEIADLRTLRPGPSDAGAARHLLPEPLIESDVPEIRAEAELAVQGVTGSRERAERLTRHVNAILDKKPTMSPSSVCEILRRRVGDCNEHTSLYVAAASPSGSVLQHQRQATCRSCTSGASSAVFHPPTLSSSSSISEPVIRARVYRLGPCSSARVQFHGFPGARPMSRARVRKSLAADAKAPPVLTAV